MKTFVLPLMLFVASAAAAVDEDPAYRDQIGDKVKQATSAVSSAASDVAKLDEIKKLKSEIEAEKERVRKDLDRAREAKSAESEITPLDAKDTEILRIYYSLKPVFDQSLSEAFAKNAEFKRKACANLPHDVKFRDMASMPEGSSPPPSTQLALDLTAALCEKPKSAK